MNTDKYLTQKKAAVEKNFGATSKEMVNFYYQVADVQMNKGKVKEAETNARTAVEVSKQVSNEPTVEKIEANIMLARLLFFNKGEFKESKTLLDSAEKMGKAVYGETHPRIVWILTNQAFYHETRGQHENSSEIYEEILRIQRKLYSEDHPLIASILNQKASSLFHSENYERAQEEWEKALDIRKKSLGEEHPKVTEILSNLGLLKFETEDFAGAIDAFSESLRIQRKVMKPNDPQIGFSLIGRGKSMVAAGDATNAEKEIREGLALLEKTFFKSTWYFKDAQSELGICLLALGRTKEAKPLLEDTYSVLFKKRGADHPKTKRHRESLMRLYRMTGESSEKIDQLSS